MGVVGLIFFKVDFDEVFRSLKNIHIEYLSLAFIMIITKTLIHSLRTQLLLTKNPTDFSGLFQITCLQNSLTYLIPMGLGEFSFIFLVKKIYRVVLIEGLMVLFVARSADFIVLSFLVALTTLNLSNYFLVDILWTVIGTAAIILIFFVALLMASQTVWIQQLLFRIEVRYSGLIPRLIISNGIKFVHSLAYVRQRKIYVPLLIYTMSMWGCIYCFLYFVIRSLGEHITLWNAVILSAINVPLMLLPIKGIGNLGNHEIGWVTALRIFGFDQNQALNTAIVTHTIILGLITLLGLWGFFGFIIRSAKGNRA